MLVLEKGKQNSRTRPERVFLYMIDNSTTTTEVFDPDATVDW